MRRAFTMVEMMVVVTIIAVLLAALTTSVNAARTRARIAKATQEVKELTNAILAYEQYAEGHTLAGKANGSWTDCNRGSLSMVLGGETVNNQQIPVLFNATLTGAGEEMLDPWGKPYQLMIRENSKSLTQAEIDSVFTGVALPNFFRLSDKERR